MLIYYIYTLNLKLQIINYTNTLRLLLFNKISGHLYIEDRVY